MEIFEKGSEKEEREENSEEADTSKQLDKADDYLKKSTTYRNLLIV